MAHTVTTVQPAQAPSDVQPQTVRALIPGDRDRGYRESITEVTDTGRRRTRWMPAITGHKQYSYVEALVHVPGEDELWWIAVERLEPEGYEEHAVWLRALVEDRPRVERHLSAEDDVRRASRRAAQRRYQERQRAAGGAR